MMSFDIKSISIDELLQRINAQPEGNIWLALIVASSAFNQAIDELRGMFSIFIEYDVEVISADSKALSLIKQVEDASEDYLLLRDFEFWAQEDWREFDYLRSRLDKNKHGGILMLSLESSRAMSTYAPNFVSWLGSRIFCLTLGQELLTIEEREVRLSALREWSGRSDSEVIALAEAHQLPPDPEYGEWLVLLERGDLLER